MSDRVLEIQTEARLSWNYIPSGRQLHRTPPLTGVKKQLDFCHEDSSEEHAALRQSAEADGGEQDDDNQNTMLDFDALGIKSEPDDPRAMLRGMTGYQLTQTDSEFMEKMKMEKLVQKLQGELEELQRSSMKERTLLKLALASRQEARDGLQALPSGEDFTEWVKAVLKITSPFTDVTDLDAKSLLGMVTRKDIQRATDVKSTLIRVKKRVARTREPVTGQLEKLVALGQLEVQKLMRELSDLKSELSQQEEVYTALKMQLIAQEAPDVPAEEADAKRQATRPVKGSAKTKALGATEKLQDSTKQGKSTRSKLGDSRTVVKDDQAKTLKTKPKSGAADQKRAGGPRQEAEAQESNSREYVRRRRKPPAPQGKPQSPPGPAAPQVKPQSPADAGVSLASSLQGRKRAAAEEAALPPVLRRSKRIASRR
ncbi:peptidoglycan DL-endopeptidase CwlO-like [Clinocottus analis]|uniref:peptidoglycan DL-endopeptidase CwlO-like n=1 Tax=Clinocottus analis TaxID=304258 RepID=UPI0035C0A3F2